MGTLFVDKLDPQSGTSLEIGSSGDTITVPSGCTITNSGTANGFVAAQSYFKMIKNADQSISASTNTVVTLEVTTYDSDSGADLSNNRYVVQSGKAGRWYVQGGVFCTGGGANNISRAYALLYGGDGNTNIGWGNMSPNNQYGEMYQVTVAGLYDASVGDIFQLQGRIETNSGSGARIDGTGNTMYTYMQGFRLI